MKEKIVNKYKIFSFVICVLLDHLMKLKKKKKIKSRTNTET